MSLHTILVFVHVLSAMILAGSALLSLLSLLALRRAQRVEQARSILELVALSEPPAGIALLLTPTAGLIMTFQTWGWQHAWINVAMGSMFVLLLPAGATAGIRRGKIAKLLKDLPDGFLPSEIQQRIQDPVLTTAIYLMLMLIIGIVFLMTTKPSLTISLTTMSLAVVIAVTASSPMWRQRGRIPMKQKV